MKQQVNLLALVIQREGPLTTNLLLSVWGVMIVIIAIYSGYQLYKLADTRSGLEILSTTRDKIQGEYENAVAQLPSKDETEFLNTKIETLDNEIQSKQRVIAQLSGRSIGNTSGFSIYLKGFANQIQDGIWLRNILIADGGTNLAIQGSTVAPDLVPRLLQRLSNEDAFKGTEFRSFTMARQEDNDKKIDFSIQTSELILQKLAENSEKVDVTKLLKSLRQ